MRVENRKTYRATPAESSVYIGRPSPLGNPYVIGRDGDRSEVIDLYRKYARLELAANSEFREAFLALADTDVLLCWCAPLACHGDVLIEEQGGLL